jgi:hypothetical protein
MGGNKFDRTFTIDQLFSWYIMAGTSHIQWNDDDKSRVVWFFLFLCWSVFMQQIWILIYLVFISFSIKKNTDLKENRSAACQICYLPLLFYCFRRKHRYQSRSHYRVIKPNYDRNIAWIHFNIGIRKIRQRGIYHHHFIECDLFPPWYIRKTTGQ